MSSFINEFNRLKPLLSTTDQASGSQNQAGEKNQPLLKKHKIKFTPDDIISQLVSGYNQIILALRNKKLLSIDINQDKQIDCELIKYLGKSHVQAKIHKIFIDPTGRFTLISLAYSIDNQPLDNLLYVKRLQSLPKLKGYLINCVAWNYPRHGEQDSNSSGTVLVGTTKGLVLQTEFNYSDESKFFPLTSGPRQYVREIFDAGPDSGPIVGLEYHQLPSKSSDEGTFFIFIATPSRIYKMQGSISTNIDPLPLQQIVMSNLGSFHDVPGKLNTSKLDFYRPREDSIPTRYAWLVDNGVMTGSCNTSANITEYWSDSNMISLTSSIQDDELYYNFPSSAQMSPISKSVITMYDKPFSMAVTNFHVIVLYRYCIRAICILNENIVFEEYFETTDGNVVGMCKDSIRNTVWVYFERAIYRYKISNENKNIWKIFLDKKEFELARKYSMNDKLNYDRVVSEEGQYYYMLKDYNKSAEIFARSQKSFEEVALMFLSIKKFDSLKKYLLVKFEMLDVTQDIQAMLVLAWLFEIMTSQISIESDKIIRDSLNEEFEQLFERKQFHDCVRTNPDLFYNITKSYSCSSIFLMLAKILNDTDKIVQHYMDKGDHLSALDTIVTSKRIDLIDIYGHILMKSIPEATVSSLLKFPNLNPCKLISILIQEEGGLNSIRYLEDCLRLRKSESKLLHNYLFELYAKYKDEESLIDYLQSDAKCEDSNYFYLDLHFCLRVCSKLKLTKTSVILYSLMDLYDEAVSLALTFDIELAKSIAKQPESIEQRKKLWLDIAERVLTSNRSIKIATSLLSECGLLKIEDILPFFPEYSTIDLFKDAIQKSLSEYRKQISKLKETSFDDMATEIREGIKSFRNRYLIVKKNQKCERCSQPLANSVFLVFPCGHLMHKNCIMKELALLDPCLSDVETVMRECIYCSDLLISYIDRPPNLDLLASDSCY